MMTGLPAQPEPEAESVNEMATAGGFVVRPMDELRLAMRERIKRRRFDPNPERMSSEYDELK